MNLYVFVWKNLLNLSALPSSYKEKQKTKKVKRQQREKKKEKYSLCSLFLLTLCISSPAERSKTNTGVRHTQKEPELVWN